MDCGDSMSTIAITSPTIGLYDLVVRYLGNEIMGDIVLNSPIITNIANTSSININDIILSDSFIAGTYVISKTINSITLSANATLTSTGQLFYIHKNNIFIGYQNNYPLPKDNDFIIISDLNPRIKHQGITTIDKINDKIITQTMRDTVLQIDFYGVNAMDNAIIFQHLFMTPIATDFLNDYNVSGHEVGNIMNLTDTLDIDNYVDRFTIKISLFSNAILTDNWLYTNTTDLTLIKV